MEDEKRVGMWESRVARGGYSMKGERGVEVRGRESKGFPTIAQV
jgi:hypothetical protein